MGHCNRCEPFLDCWNGTACEFPGQPAVAPVPVPKRNAHHDLNAWQIFMLEKIVREELARNPVPGLPSLLREIE